MQLHKAKEVETCVEKELDWFSTNRLIPKSVKRTPSLVSLNNFKSLIHNRPYNLFVNPYEMFPDELARLCGERYLSGDHMMYVVRKLNEMQDDVLCVYGNYNPDPKKCLERFMRSKQQLPTRIAFLLNVGSNPRNGETYIGTYEKPGNHFAMAIVSDRTTCTYGDSLGWMAPIELKDLVDQYCKVLYGEGDVNIVECHKPHSGNETQMQY